MLKATLGFIPSRCQRAPRLRAGVRPTMMAAGREVDVDGHKRCTRCQVDYQRGHWAYQRTKCPVCGTALVELEGAEGGGLAYEHYDSSVDVEFDLSGLLGPGQRHEARIVALSGGLLLAAACAARFFYMFLSGGHRGFRAVPLWFDLIAGLMALGGLVALVWGLRRLVRHRRALRRGG